MTELEQLEKDAVLDGLAQEVASESQANTSNREPIVHDSLLSALNACVASRKLIAAEQEQLTFLVEQATNSIERAAREYQRDLIAWQLSRAADVAEKAITVLRTVD